MQVSKLECAGELVSSNFLVVLKTTATGVAAALSTHNSTSLASIYTQMDLLHFTFIGIMALASLFWSDTNKYTLTSLLKLKTLLLDHRHTYTPAVLSSTIRNELHNRGVQPTQRDE